MKKENKGLSILANLDILIAAAVLAVLVVLTFLGVIWRYFLAHPFTWLEEVQMLSLIHISGAPGYGAGRRGSRKID